MSSEGSVPQKMIVLESTDGVRFEVPEAVALQSQFIKDLMDVCGDNCIPLPNVNSKTLAKVIEYCKRHMEANDGDGLKAFDEEFVKVDQSILHDLILAANYLNIRSLLDLTCQTFADMIKDRPEEIHKILNIEVDVTPEEEAQIRRENAWLFE